MLCKCNVKKLSICLAVSGAISAVLSPLSGMIIHMVLQSQVPSSLDLTPEARSLGSSGQFGAFRKQVPGKPDDRIISIYMFNISNAPAVLQGRELPSLNESDPFVYSYAWERYNLTWSKDQDTLSYQEWMYYRFIKCTEQTKDVACSESTDDATFTVPNLPFLGLYYGIGGINLAYQFLEFSVEYDETFTAAREPQDIAGWLQAILVDALYIIPALMKDENITFEAIEQELLFTKVSVKNFTFGFDVPEYAALYSCDETRVDFDEKICNFLSLGKENCTTWMPQCLNSTKYPFPKYRQLGVCEEVRMAQLFRKFLEFGCPLKKMLPPRFPGLGFVNVTNKSVGQTPGVDRTMQVKTGKVSEQDAFWLTQRYGMQEMQVCPNSVDNPGLPCPFGAQPSYPYRDLSGGRVNGSDGLRFTPFLDGSETLPVWVDPLNRAVHLEHHGVKPVFRDIQLYRYALRKGDIQNSTLNHANNQYFQYGSSGFFNLTMANRGIPVMACQPHWLGVDDADVIGNVKGVYPGDPDKHSFALDVEPYTGMVMDGAGRLQTNLVASPITGTPMTKLRWDRDIIASNLSKFKGKLYLPFAWFEDGGKLGAKTAADWRSSVGLLIKVRPILCTALGCLAGVFAFGAMVLLLIIMQQRKARWLADAEVEALRLSVCSRSSRFSSAGTRPTESKQGTPSGAAQEPLI